MNKITGREKRADLPEKVLLLYQAVGRLIEEGTDISNMKVSDITKEAGIGKGTAYDYFSTKEEIIVDGLMFFVGEFMENLIEGIRTAPSFKEAVGYVLTRVDERVSAPCIFRFVSLLFEPSRTGLLMRERFEENKKQVDCAPMQLCMQMLQTGIERGELRSDLPLEYMNYTLLSKLISYCTYRTAQVQSMPQEAFRDLVVAGIMDELGNT